MRFRWCLQDKFKREKILSLEEEAVNEGVCTPGARESAKVLQLKSRLREASLELQTPFWLRASDLPDG